MTWKIVGFLVLAQLLLLLILQLPLVQNYLAQQVVSRMEATLETEVELERLHVRWFDKLVLKNLFVEDPYTIKDGQATVTDAPGWGVEINPDWLDKASYQVSETGH